MKGYIDKDEWYPVFSVSKDNTWDNGTGVVEIPDELYEKYRKNMDEFGDIQVELRHLFNPDG